MFYFEINGGKITGKGSKNVDVLNDNEVEVSEEIYDALIRMPADFATNSNGNIISVTNAPELEPQPQPPTTEERLRALEDAMIIALTML